MASGNTTYAIVGGGIVGSSIAYHLSKRTDADITVFEMGSIGSETTQKSMAQFGLYGDEAQYRMKRYGLRLYNEFFESPRADLRYNLAGQLHVATTEAGAKELREGVEGDVGPKALSGSDRDLLEYVPGDELDSVLLLPHLNTEPIVGAAFRPRVGLMNPRALAIEFADRARANGVTFETGVRVTDVRTMADRVAGLTTSRGDVDVDEVICAAGPWNPSMARRAGIEVPVRHTLGPILKLDPGDSVEYSLPSIYHHEGISSIYRHHSRTRGAMYLGHNPSEPVDDLDTFSEAYAEYDPATVDETIPDDLRADMLETAELLMPSLLRADVVDEWVGIRSMTPDGNPIVGWTALEGFSIAAFHSSGIQLAPKVGDVIARQLVDGEPTSLYESLSIARFDGFTDIHGGTP